MSEQKVQIEARVLEYLPNAMQDDYEDSYASYDATKLEVLSPLEYRGRQVMIFHDVPVPAGTLWRRTGARLRATVDPAGVFGSDTVFAAALAAVQEVAPEGR